VAAGCKNTTGDRNNFIGDRAGRNNTAGRVNNFIGMEAGCLNTTGSYNSFFGNGAGRDNTTGNFNTFIGPLAGINSGGSENTFIGYYAGNGNANGCNNIAIGRNAGGYNNGVFELGSVSNRILMGNGSHTCAQIKISWTVTSDCRDKFIFGSVQHGRGFLQNLEPIEYAFKDRITGCITDFEGKRRYGFSAQNVLAAEGEHPVIVSTEDEEKLQLTSDYLIPVLVNAVNELSAESNAMLAEIVDLKARLAALEAK
jgi:hypothetical protein